MAGVLKETSAVNEYWLEPDSRRVVPVSLSVTDLSGKVMETVAYSPYAGTEIAAGISRRHGVLIDFGREVGGFPHLTFGTGGCKRAGYQAVESIEHLFIPAVAGPLSLGDPTVVHQHFRVEEDVIVDLPHHGGFRYIWVYPEHAGRATLGDVWVDYTPYLTEDKDGCGYFLSSDDLLNRIWFAGLHTVEMCTVPPALGALDSRHVIGDGEWVLIDGAKRDRLIWAGDLSPAGVSTCVSNNNSAALRDSLISLARHQHNNGYIPACSPGPMPGRLVNAFFGDYVAWWVVSLYQYYMHTGDAETVLELFPRLKRALHYLHSQCRGGLFRQTPFNMFEWCYTVLRRGKPSYTNVMYYWALNCASYLAHEVGDEEVSLGFVSRAYRLGEAIERDLWDPDRGVFIDTTVDRTRVPQDGNSLAIVSGLTGEPSTAEGILAYLREKNWVEWGSTNVDVPYFKLTPGLQPHNRRVVPFMDNFEALARFVSHDDESAVELVRRCWGTMVNLEPNTTFWEWIGKDGLQDGHFTSMCHGWSAGVVALLVKYVLGIRPVAAGYRRFKFDPRPVGLDWVEGRVPVPGGFIEARVEKKKDGYRTRFKAPTGIVEAG